MVFGTAPLDSSVLSIALRISETWDLVLLIIVLRSVLSLVGIEPETSSEVFRAVPPLTTVLMDSVPLGIVVLEPDSLVSIDDVALVGDLVTVALEVDGLELLLLVREPALSGLSDLGGWITAVVVVFSEGTVFPFRLSC